MSTEPKYLEQLRTTKSDTELIGGELRGADADFISLVLAPTRDVEKDLS